MEKEKENDMAAPPPPMSPNQITVASSLLLDEFSKGQLIERTKPPPLQRNSVIEDRHSDEEAHSSPSSPLVNPVSYADTDHHIQQQNSLSKPEHNILSHASSRPSGYSQMNVDNIDRSDNITHDDSPSISNNMYSSNYLKNYQLSDSIPKTHNSIENIHTIENNNRVPLNPVNPTSLPNQNVPLYDDSLSPFTPASALMHVSPKQPNSIVVDASSLQLHNNNIESLTLSSGGDSFNINQKKSPYHLHENLTPPVYNIRDAEQISLNLKELNSDSNQSAVFVHEPENSIKHDEHHSLRNFKTHASQNPSQNKIEEDNDDRLSHTTLKSNSINNTFLNDNHQNKLVSNNNVSLHFGDDDNSNHELSSQRINYLQLSKLPNPEQNLSHVVNTDSSTSFVRNHAHDLPLPNKLTSERLLDASSAFENVQPEQPAGRRLSIGSSGKNADIAKRLDELRKRRGDRLKSEQQPNEN